MKKLVLFDKVKRNKELVALGTAILLGGTLLGCTSPQMPSQNPLSPVAEEVPAKHYEQFSEKASQNVTDLGVKLMKNHTGGNQMISPASIYLALAMTAEGAEEETLKQMEETLGMSLEEIRQFAGGYMESLKYSGSAKVKMANSVWTNDTIPYTYRQEVMDLLEKQYSAELKHEVFDQQGTADRINAWIEEHTDDMIHKTLDEVPKEAALYLINALVFDAKWSEEYIEDAIRTDIFTNENGTEKEVEFMNSTEGSYLSDENTTGVMKYYKDGKYAFVGLLPEEGMSMDEYVSNLSGEKIVNLIQNRSYGTVYTKIPEFAADYKVDMASDLQLLGMNDLFEEGNANLQKFTEEENSFFVSHVIHQTHVEVNREGTKAAAVTVVEVDSEATSVEEPLESYYVYLNRPFVYIIWDVDQSMPLFIGTMETM